jgi:hypothetical protein
VSAAEEQRFHSLAGLTARVARAAAELEALRPEGALLPERQRRELEELTDRLQALHLLLANEVERAWNAAEADARRRRHAEVIGRVQDAISAETTLPESGLHERWQEFGPFGATGPPSDGLAPQNPRPKH